MVMDPDTRCYGWKTKAIFWAASTSTAADLGHGTLTRKLPFAPGGRGGAAALSPLHPSPAALSRGRRTGPAPCAGGRCHLAGATGMAAQRRSRPTERRPGAGTQGQRSSAAPSRVPGLTAGPECREAFAGELLGSTHFRDQGGSPF